MAVLKPPSSSNLTTVAAGQYAVQIQDKVTSSWLWLNGITSFNPKNNVKLEDDSDIYGDNWDSQIAMGNGLEIAIEGLVKGEDIGTFTTDPGLAILLAAREETGTDNLVRIRYWRHDDLPEAKETNVAVNITLDGGKTNETQKWSGTLAGRGRPETITKPTAPSSFTLTVTGTAGTYTASVGGQTATGIAYNATSSAVQTALAGLSTVGAGNVTVTGTGGVYTVTLANGGTLTADGTGLTGGTATVTAL